MAKLTVYRTRDGRRYGVLSGSETGDYSIEDVRWFASKDPDNPNESGDTRAWLEERATACGLAVHEYAYSFQHIRVASDVQKIGDFCFCFFENAEVTFENPSGLAHLGKRALSRTGICGRVALPGLQDALFPDVFSGCTRLEEVDFTGSQVQEIGEGAFNSCYGLKRLKGCRKVHTVGPRAFLRCTALTDIDLNPQTLRSVGYAALHISSVGESLDGFSAAFAETARRIDKFDAPTLARMQAVELPDAGGLPKVICEQNYPDLRYALVNGQKAYMVDGCMMLSLFHVYQRMFPEAEFGSFPDWWEYVDSLCVDAAGMHIYETERYTTDDVQKITYLVLYLLGLKPKNFGEYELRYPYIDASCEYHCGLMTHDETAKYEIWTALSRGYGVIASVSTGKAEERTKLFLRNHHAVAVVGCRNGKLLVVDSANVDGATGGVYEVAYEDLFIGAPYSENRIWVIEPGEENG